MDSNNPRVLAVTFDPQVSCFLPWGTQHLKHAMTQLHKVMIQEVFSQHEIARMVGNTGCEVNRWSVSQHTTNHHTIFSAEVLVAVDDVSDEDLVYFTMKFGSAKVLELSD